MTDQEINAAIAELQGWMFCDGWHSPDGTEPIEIPDYCNDLNAIAEAVKSMDRDTFLEYGLILMDVCAPGEPLDVLFAIAVVCNASSRQRAEAYLRTVGKWRGA